MILYIGNILSSKGLSPAPIELIKDKICKSLGIKMITASDKKNKGLRFLHMNYVFWCNYRKVSLLFIDVYSTKAFYFALYFSIISKILSLKYIPIIHGGNIESRIKKTRWLTNFIFKNADVSIAPSIFVFNIFKKNNYSIRYIPNCIDFSYYKFKIREKIRPRIFWLRAFHGIYNPEMAIYVLKDLCEFYSNASLTMVGADKDGSLKKCKEISKKYNLNHKVKFFGYLKKFEWIEKAKKHDIFINTSKIDNMPVSIIEMMALGLPIISTNVGGIPFILESHKNSLLVRSNDIKNMSMKIKYLIENHSIATTLSINALHDSKKFSTDLVIPEWVKIIKKYFD